jgi:hypothetical protein
MIWHDLVDGGALELPPVGPEDYAVELCVRLAGGRAFCWWLDADGRVLAEVLVGQA